MRFAALYTFLWCVAGGVLVSPTIAAPILFVDQAQTSWSNTNQFTDGVAPDVGDRYAQTFVPTMEAIDVFEVRITAGNQQQFQGHVRDGGPTGTILGSSGIFEAPSSVGTYLIHFDLGSRISLTPGSTYALDVVYVANPNSGSSPVMRLRDNDLGDAYANGTSYKNGTPMSWDIFFIEGLHSPVPEPSTMAMLVAGALGLGLVRASRARRQR